MAPGPVSLVSLYRGPSTAGWCRVLQVTTAKDSMRLRNSSGFIDHIYTHKKIGFLHGRYKYSRGQAIPVQDPEQLGRFMYFILDNAISSPLSHVRLLTPL